MPKHQLTLSPDYVLDWTYVEAVREIFQNALDNQTTNPENEMFFSYENNKLQIGNKTSILTLDSLLLGTSTKRDNENTIGKHGEGYKVALMVLLREGKTVTIYNYGAREIWKTRLVKSRKFNGALITEIDVQKKAFFQSVPSHNLIFEIEGVTEEEYQNIINHNLHLQENIEKFTTTNGMGDILLSEEHKGKIFINGLYVTTNPQFQYGYNIAPKHIELDRDRKLLDTFNLTWTTSKMWRYVNQESRVAQMLLENVLDVKYIKERRDHSTRQTEEDIDRTITTNLHKLYIETHGKNTVPVWENSQLQKVAKSTLPIKPVMVTESVSSFLQGVIDVPEELTMSPKDRLREWFDTVQHKLSEEEKSDFEIILDDMSS